jgi:hypothetical protein
MSVSIDNPVWIRIEAPDGPRALALERRLSHLHASAVARHGRWTVEIEDLDDRLEEVEAAVRQWLRMIGAPAACMHIGDVTRTVMLPLQQEAPQLGAGYDTERVLEHEP